MGNIKRQSEEILINVTPQETRVAIVENGMLQELHIERNDARGIVGNVYKGKVVRVLPGMQAAFVDIGLERTAFLRARDAAVNINRAEMNGDSVDGEGEPPEKPINELVHEGQELLVQVVKDPMGTKGARISTGISLPSRYLVYLPHDEMIGISQQITDLETREALRSMIEELKEKTGCSGGYIVRTTAETAQSNEMQQDMEFLQKLWTKVRKLQKKSSAPTLVYQDLPLPQRALRDFMREWVERISIDSTETYDKVVALAKELMPAAINHIEHYPGERPIFDLYSIEDEIGRALSQTVPLKSGGHLVIDQTEAMTTVDVNTGAFTGRKTLEETVFKTNLEAAQGLARQLRLRNIGGIIIVDFIDMLNPSHQNQVLGALERSLEKDSTKT